MQMTKTTIPKQKDIERKCYLIDADGKVLGKIAAKAAAILRGKTKPTFTPHLDTGDNVVIINASKLKVTGKKLTDKIYQRYSGYPSGQRTLKLEEMMVKSSSEVIRIAINRMIPSGRLGNHIRKRVRVYATEVHPHQAQNPIPLEV